VDALTLLKKEHDEVKKMLKGLDDTTDRAIKTRREMFERLKFSLDARVTRRADENHQSPSTGGLNRALRIRRRWVSTPQTEEAVMFIGEVEETGFIEPVVFPRAVPDDEPAPRAEEPELEPVQAG